MNKSSSQILLAMSAPPYWHCGQTVFKRSLDFLIALTPAAIMAVYTWGISAARVMALAVLTAVATEALAAKAMKRPVRVDNLTAVVSALLLAFLLPASSPWWIVMLGSAAAILFGKMLFGGLGNCPMPTPVVGWAILFVSYPLLADPNLMQLATSFTDPLSRVHAFGPAAAGSYSIADLLLGRQVSALGAGQVGALLLGGAYLLIRGTVRWQVVLGVLLGVALPFGILHAVTPETSAPVLFELCTGSVVLCAFFIATEANTIPTHFLAMFLYGITVGLLIFAIRRYGSYADGAPFAVMACSLLTPYFDMIRPKPFGVR